MATRSGSRRYYVVGESGATVRPRVDATLTLRDNVTAIARWEWGDRRAAWAAALADELDVSEDVTEDVAEWAAAVLCATAVDSGRDRRAGWSRTLTALSEMTGVSRETMLDRFAQLRALRPTA